MVESRVTSRKRTFLGAQVTHPYGLPLPKCIVRDLSETGAQLRFSHPVSLPGTVDLKITKTGERFRAEVV